MHGLTRNAAIAGFASLLIAAALPPAASAQDVTFSAGSRVEGRFGSNWDRCTVVGARRTTGGYLLRCDLHPDQENVFAASDVRAMQGADRAVVRKPPARSSVALQAPAATTPSRAFISIPPRAGVYGCMNQDAMELAGLQFGILDAHTYSTYDGARGRYSYSAQTGMLTFTSGPFARLQRSRYTERSFLILDEHGARTAFVCPWEPKDPRKLHW
ncbi:MAG: hypothetical protein JWN27_137 [Candidatus Eremiobacteraeota bacterium]|nr:hypothetical protein [Candidatus Eremiobacteraeota bacterium]